MYGKSLAHVERIKEVHSIEGADNIERVTVLDWNLVAKKGSSSPVNLPYMWKSGLYSRTASNRQTASSMPTLPRLRPNTAVERTR